MATCNRPRGGTPAKSAADQAEVGRASLVRDLADEADFLAVLLIIAALLLAILILLFLPGSSYTAGQSSLRSQQAAVGRVVLAAAHRDPDVAARIRAALQVAPEDDRVLASELIANLPRQ